MRLPCTHGGAGVGFELSHPFRRKRGMDGAPQPKVDLGVLSQVPKSEAPGAPNRLRALPANYSNGPEDGCSYWSELRMEPTMPPSRPPPMAGAAERLSVWGRYSLI